MLKFIVRGPAVETILLASGYCSFVPEVAGILCTVRHLRFKKPTTFRRMAPWPSSGARGQGRRQSPWPESVEEDRAEGSLLGRNLWKRTGQKAISLAGIGGGTLPKVNVRGDSFGVIVHRHILEAKILLALSYL
jgi:hypothetical protein